MAGTPIAAIKPMMPTTIINSNNVNPDVRRERASLVAAALSFG
jgi:hypothetical protein